MEKKTYLATIEIYDDSLEGDIEMAVGNGLANAYIDCDYEVNKIKKASYPICNVGDKIYVIVPDKDNDYIAKEVEVCEISWNQNGMFYKTYPSLPGITQDKFGKTAFLSQQAANSKAEELSKNDKENRQDIESYLDSNEPYDLL